MHADTPFAEDGMARWPREDNLEPRSLQLPLEVRATYEFDEEGVQREARRPEKEKKNRRKKEGSKRWPGTLAKRGQRGGKETGKDKKTIIILHKKKRKEAKDGMARWPREDNEEPRSLQLDFKVRGRGRGWGGGNGPHPCLAG